MLVSRGCWFNILVCPLGLGPSLIVRIWAHISNIYGASFLYAVLLDQLKALIVPLNRCAVSMTLPH